MRRWKYEDVKDFIENNSNCIPLLRIPYSKYASIDKILSNSLL